MQRTLTSLLFVCLSCACLAVLFGHAETPVPRPAAPVLSLREFELKPGVNRDEFERFARDEMAVAVSRSLHGLKIQVLKGDRGERKNSYLLVWQFESVALRDECFPREGGWTCGPAFVEAWKQMKPVMDKFNGYVKVDGAYTDYVTVVE